MSNNDWQKEFPFESKFFDQGGVRQHYIDEGEGEPIVMVHGNPTWSFYYRHLISSFRSTHRVVAVDHVGCGLSDKPKKYKYLGTATTVRAPVLTAVINQKLFFGP